MLENLLMVKLVSKGKLVSMHRVKLQHIWMMDIYESVAGARQKVDASKSIPIKVCHTEAVRVFV